MWIFSARAVSKRPVQGADGRAGKELVGDMCFYSPIAIGRSITKRCAEGHDPVRWSQVKGVPALAGEGKVEALQPDQRTGTIVVQLLNVLADLLLPLQGPDPARIPPRAVGRKDQGAPVEIEQMGAVGFVRGEFHQDLIVGGHPNVFDGVGMSIWERRAVNTTAIANNILRDSIKTVHQ